MRYLLNFTAYNWNISFLCDQSFQNQLEIITLIWIYMINCSVIQKMVYFKRNGTWSIL